MKFIPALFRQILHNNNTCCAGERPCELDAVVSCCAQGCSSFNNQQVIMIYCIDFVPYEAKGINQQAAIRIYTPDFFPKISYMLINFPYWKSRFLFFSFYEMYIALKPRVHVYIFIYKKWIFGFPIFWHWVYQIKVLSETRRVH